MCKTLISDTMTTGPTSEVWCGSKKEVNNSIQVIGRGGTFPIPVCAPQVYHLQIRVNALSTTNTFPYLELLDIAAPWVDGTYFACA